MDGRTDTAIAIGALLWCERVWGGSGYVTFHDAPSTFSRRTCHRKSKALQQLKKKGGGVISLLFWLRITREFSWRTYGLHLLLANGGSRRVGTSGKFGTSLRSCAVLHPRWQSQALEVENIIIVFLYLATWLLTRYVMKHELSCGRFHTFAAKCLRTALFWVITQRAVVISCRSFGTTYGSNNLEPWGGDR